MATMHTQRAVMAVHRMISLFPGEQQEEVRSQISQVLRAVICQRLLRWNKKFITIRDILLNTHAVANLIRTRKEPQIISIQETQLPMKTLEMAVRDVKAQYGSQQQLTYAIRSTIIVGEYMEAYEYVVKNENNETEKG